MLKKYGKAIEQPQGTLPLHLHSEQMDGQSTESTRRRVARALVLSGPLLYLLRAGAFTAPAAMFSTWIPPPPIHGTWAAEKGRATVTGGSSKQKVKGTGATPPGTVSCVCSWQPRLWMEKLGGRGLAAVPLTPHFLRPRHLHASQQSWPHVPKKAMIQDREAGPTGCVIQKRGYRQRDFRNKFNFGFPTFSDHKN